MNEEPKNQIRDIPKIQRRVLGVLMEKAFTTPDQYPLTLKAATTGCNQKSNRSPITHYTEDDVQEALDGMREDLLCAEVFSDGGRAPRYRHYMRHKFDFSEAQFAIIAELMLRGRQQLGELRTRASRMVKIESQEQLRDELNDLQQKGYLQASGPLERRGVEVDHTFYLEKENKTLAKTVADDSAPPASETQPEPPPGDSKADDASTTTSFDATALEGQVTQLKATIEEQASVIGKLESLLTEMNDRLQRLERDLGV